MAARCNLHRLKAAELHHIALGEPVFDINDPEGTPIGGHIGADHQARVHAALSSSAVVTPR